MTEIQTALYGVGVAALVALASVFAVLGRRVAQYIDKLFDAKERELLRQDGIDAAFAAEEIGRREGKTGNEKLAIARNVMESLRPSATPAAKDNAILAGVAKMRASVPNADALHPVPVTVVGSSLPPPTVSAVPPPPKVPT